MSIYGTHYERNVYWQRHYRVSLRGKLRLIGGAGFNEPKGPVPCLAALALRAVRRQVGRGA